MRPAFPLLRLALAGAAALFLAAPAMAQDQFTPAQEQAIREVVKNYLVGHPEVLVEAIQALQARQAAQQADNARTVIEGERTQILHDGRDLVTGNPQGDVTLVEFFDYNCGYCKATQPVIDTLMKSDPGLRLVFKEFPILGPGSVVASRAAVASRAQGKYAAFHTALMANRGPLDENRVMAIAAGVGLDTDRLKTDMAKPDVERQIADAHDLADKMGITGTPSFVIGDNLLQGAASADDLRTQIAAARQACAGSC